MLFRSQPAGTMDTEDTTTIIAATAAAQMPTIFPVFLVEMSMTFSLLMIFSFRIKQSLSTCRLTKGFLSFGLI